MKIVKLTQGSPEWLEWRKTRFMASEAAVIMGCAPEWMAVRTWDDLRAAKEGKVEYSPDTLKRFAHGHKMEEKARADINRSWFGDHVSFEPICVESDSDSNICASLDGYDSDNAIWVEIKCPMMSRSRSRIGKIKTPDQIPDYYWWQMLHQYVALDQQATGFFFPWWPDGGNVPIKVFEPNYFDDIDGATKSSISQLLAKWSEWKAGVPDGGADSDWEMAEQEYVFLHRQLADLKKQCEEARNKLISLAGNRDRKGKAVSLARVNSPGRLDTKAMIDDGIDIEQYRSIPSSTWRVKIIA